MRAWAVARTAHSWNILIEDTTLTAAAPFPLYPSSDYTGALCVRSQEEAQTGRSYMSAMKNRNLLYEENIKIGPRTGSPCG